MTNVRFNFEYDPRKAKRNLRKHGISFDEAITVFYDPLAATLPDESHSADEHRFITIGQSAQRRVLFVVHAERPSVSSAPAEQLRPRRNNMKKSKEPAKRLDFTKAVRGKYYDRVQQGTNLVLIEPDLLDSFPDAESVNNALRTLKTIAHRSTKIPARRSTATPRKAVSAR